jgi:hypothetical protein
MSRFSHGSTFIPVGVLVLLQNQNGFFRASGIAPARSSKPGTKDERRVNFVTKPGQTLGVPGRSLMQNRLASVCAVAVPPVQSM